MAWIPTKDELPKLILPSDYRYYGAGFLGGPLLQEERRQIVDEMSLLLRSDILRVAPKEIPAKLPKKLPQAILRSWFEKLDISSERWAWWVEHLNHSDKWCHHDPERGYLMARLLCQRYRRRLLQGWRVWDSPGYSAGGVADLGVVNAKGELLIAVEIGDISPVKLVEPFKEPRFRQLWHWPYFGWPDQTKYEWQSDELYFVWTRGLRWGQIPLRIDGEETKTRSPTG